MGTLYLKGQSSIMELKKIFKKLLTSVCIIFTIVTALYMLVLQIINISDSDAAVEAGRVLLFFVFSILLSIANTILSIKKFNVILRYFLHYVISAFGFWVCFCLPNKMNFSRSFVGIVIFSIVYAVIMTIIGIFSHRLNKTKKNEKKYEKQFSTK